MTKSAFSIFADRNIALETFLHSSRLNELRDSFDPSRTFEGENFMILRQASNIMLEWTRAGKSDSPMKNFEMLNNKQPQRFKNFGEDIIEGEFPLVHTFENSETEFADVLHAYRWLIVYYLNETRESFDEWMKANGGDTFEARNRSQAEHTAIQWAAHTYRELEDPRIRQVSRNKANN
ncbi:unnamed protein product [Cylicostephanus goldi]|uniref:Uncharacterized protein n=1 Tax=Cylicostephanus goldi TaxID=71465 RepID=A0A3P7R7P0_CYLGO|nr:unnamed protein product [Cylicostephanus goldi]